MSFPRCLTVVTLIGVVAFAASAADWSRFRGPNGTGVADGPAPVQFDLKEDVAWKVKIPGVGHGSPIVVGDKTFLQSAAADGATRTVHCLSTTDGKEVWAYTVSGTQAKLHKKNNLGASTPCSDGERVYAAYWDGTQVKLTALDMAGKEVWTKQLGEFANEHGFAHSPMVFDGLVYFNLDMQDAADVLAFDAKTGERKWAAKRKGHRACYTVPMIAEKAGKPELIVGSTTTIDSYDPKTGKSNWTYTVQWEKAGIKPLRAIGQPVLAGGQVVTYFGEGGSGRYMVAVKDGGRGDVTATAKAWDLTKGTPYVPGLIVRDDHLYWVTDDGLAACADAKTGRTKWTERVLPKGASSSPILIGETVLVFGEDGTAAAFAASPKGAGEVKRSAVGEPVFATPAVANGRLYVRGGDHLFCIRQKGS
jgi:outer membrane protein assembly factor BamB